MKKLLLLFTCLILAACSDDDQNMVVTAPVQLSTITLTHNGDELTFKNLEFNTPYNDHDLWVVGYIDFDETESGLFEYLVSLTFKLEENEYKMQSFNFNVVEKRSPNLYYHINYYAFQTGELASTDFFASTTTDTDENKINGTFSGILNSSADGDTTVSNGNFEIFLENNTEN